MSVAGAPANFSRRLPAHHRLNVFARSSGANASAALLLFLGLLRDGLEATGRHETKVAQFFRERLHNSGVTHWQQCPFAPERQAFAETSGNKSSVHLQVTGVANGQPIGGSCSARETSQRSTLLVAIGCDLFVRE
jgi:hypothetical protein